MTGARAELPYAGGSLRFDLPPAWSMDVAEIPTPPSGSLDVEAASALRAPVAGPLLSRLAHPGMTVTVVVPDLTRPCPTRILLPLLLHELFLAGVGQDDVAVVVALGMHRPTSPTERAALLGPWASQLTVVDARALEASAHRDLGTLGPDDEGNLLGIPIPVRLHRRVVECDLLLSLGVVEPHQIAGFSGGPKTVAIGCAGAETITALHGLAALEHRGTRVGTLEGNPVQSALRAIASRARLCFALNVALDGSGRLVGAASGEPAAVLAHLVERLSPFVWAPVAPEPYDVVFAGVPESKAVNLYQVSRALTYVAFASRPVLREGGWLVTAARCEEGAGRGPGEDEFVRCMQSGATPEAVLARLRDVGFGAGGQRAYFVAKTIARHRAMAVGVRDQALVKTCHLHAVADAPAAVQTVQARVGSRARVLVVPNALAILPLPGSQKPA